MRKIGLILTGLMIYSLTFGQILKVQVGTSISQLDWKFKGINIDPLYDKMLTSYSVLAGLDYMDKKYINISSNVGIIRKGGKSETKLVDQSGLYTGETIVEKPTLDYLSINTTIDLKYKIKEAFSPFVSFGPRFDYLINSSKYFDNLKDLNELKSTSIGLILGGGFKYDMSKIQLGLRADYYLDFTKIADWTIAQSSRGGEVTVKTFTINLTIGYKLK